MSDLTMDRNEENRLVAMTRELCAGHLPATVAPRVTIRWGSATKAMGLAHFGLLSHPSITYSRPLFAATTEADRIETVAHEVAHLVVFYDLVRDRGLRPGGPLFPRGEAHGPRWRAVMARLGYQNPKTHHDVHVPRRARRDDVTIVCPADQGQPCTNTAVMTLARAARMNFRCRKCSGAMRPLEPHAAIAIALLRTGTASAAPVSVLTTEGPAILRPANFPAGAVEKARILRDWPAQSVLQFARQLLPQIPEDFRPI